MACSRYQMGDSVRRMARLPCAFRPSGSRQACTAAASASSQMPATSSSRKRGQRAGREAEEAGRWDRRALARRFLEQLGSRLKLSTPQEWAKVGEGQVRRQGGARLLQHYGSVQAALADALPHMAQGSRGLGERKAQRELLLRMEKALGLQSAAEWAEVRRKQVEEQGGGELLAMYRGSRRRMLVATFPERREELEAAFDAAAALRRPGEEERRQVVRRVAEKCGVRRVEDWRKVTREDFVAAGGGAALRMAGSVLALLQEAHPEAELRAWHCRPTVPAAYWKDKERRREFVRHLAQKYDVTSAEEWAKVRVEDVRQAGGASLLGLAGGLLPLLQETQPELDLSVFGQGRCRTSAPHGYWREASNVTAFVEEVRRRFGVTDQEHWYRLSMEELRQVGNPFQTVAWVDMLRTAYPHLDWDVARLSSPAKRASQRRMREAVAAILS